MMLDCDDCDKDLGCGNTMIDSHVNVGATCIKYGYTLCHKCYEKRCDKIEEELLEENPSGTIIKEEVICNFQLENGECDCEGVHLSYHTKKIKESVYEKSLEMAKICPKCGGDMNDEIDTIWDIITT